MSFDAQMKNRVFYVHKLRLEAREGADVEIRSPVVFAVRTQGGWIVAKLVGVALAVAALLVVVASQ